MQQLTPVDAVFLSMETERNPGHIGGLAVLDPSTHPDACFHFDSFVEFVTERLSLIPRFGWILQEVPFGLDQPYWVDPCANGRTPRGVERQIHQIGVPQPGGTKELSELASHLFEGPLDRSRPLWEMYFMEGLQGGRVALLWKVHHAMMDGVSGAGLVEQLFDIAPVPGLRSLVPVDDTAQAGAPVGLGRLAWNGLLNAAVRPPALVKHAVRAGRQVARQVWNDGLESVSLAPPSLFNGAVGPDRAVAWSQLSLERVKTLKSALDVTVNDVVLAITSDSVRRYLSARDALPEASLVAAVPVSIRCQGDTSMGNQISEIGIDWATHIDDPLERIFAIHGDSLRAKQSHKADAINPVEAMAESLVPGAMQMLAQLTAQAGDNMPLPANVVVSNVPMSPIPLFIGGARIESVVPMSLLPPTQGLNITVVSYCGELHFGLIADPEMVDGLWEIADAIPKALVDLEAAAEAMPHVDNEPRRILSQL